MDSFGGLVEAAEREDGNGLIPFRMLAATAFILAAAFSQPKGRFSKAKASLATAMSHLHLAAKGCAIDLQASPNLHEKIKKELEDSSFLCYLVCCQKILSQATKTFLTARN